MLAKLCIQKAWKIWAAVALKRRVHAIAAHFRHPPKGALTFCERVECTRNE